MNDGSRQACGEQPGSFRRRGPVKSASREVNSPRRGAGARSPVLASTVLHRDFEATHSCVLSAFGTRQPAPRRDRNDQINKNEDAWVPCERPPCHRPTPSPRQRRERDGCSPPPRCADDFSVRPTAPGFFLKIPHDPAGAAVGRRRSVRERANGATRSPPANTCRIVPRGLALRFSFPHDVALSTVRLRSSLEPFGRFSFFFFGTTWALVV